uniref:Pectin acetylesterase n=1 Tax=Entomoneis paludosa TaxID=265537 RepID=A0A7S3DP49_9STRA|mmetsp:Transcript_25203/g.52411  ORF Transcript_25203/g.52411 Transcript_25203/m.52411 type:complete len:431 (+) Transcript_25203:348-1640(+)
MMGVFEFTALSFTFVLLLSSVVGTARADDQTLKLVDLPIDLISQHKAYCLDGSPYKYYIQRTQFPGYENDYVIYFEGGGWCYTKEKCTARALTKLGSSINFTDTKHAAPLISDDSLKNPIFFRYNHVFLPYCDGASFSGNQEEPVDGLWYRGMHNLEIVLDHIGIKNKASNVLITGCSAGGLSTYLHADPIREKLPKSANVKAMPESGFFWFHKNAEGESIYETQMKNTFTLHNSTSGVHPKCIETLSPNEHYKCISAAKTLEFIETPILIFNSAYDTWNIGCVWAAEPAKCHTLPGWESCSKDFNCTESQIRDLWDFADLMMEDIVRSGILSRSPSNGVFIHSCLTHCGLQNKDLVNKLSIRGDSFLHALAQWWYTSASPPQEHLMLRKSRTHWPCRLRPTEPHGCNPSCAATNSSMADGEEDYFLMEM